MTETPMSQEDLAPLMAKIQETARNLAYVTETYTFLPRSVHTAGTMPMPEEGWLMVQGGKVIGRVGAVEKIAHDGDALAVKFTIIPEPHRD